MELNLSCEAVNCIESEEEVEEMMTQPDKGYKERELVIGWIADRLEKQREATLKKNQVVFYIYLPWVGLLKVIALSLSRLFSPEIGGALEILLLYFIETFSTLLLHQYNIDLINITTFYVVFMTSILLCPLVFRKS